VFIPPPVYRLALLVPVAVRDASAGGAGTVGEPLPRYALSAAEQDVRRSESLNNYSAPLDCGRQKTARGAAVRKRRCALMRSFCADAPISVIIDSGHLGNTVRPSR